MTTQTKPPVWYWIVSIIAFLWNAMGVMAYLSRAFMTDADRATLPEDMQLYLAELPAWYTAVFAIAVFGGTLGGLALLFKKAMAYPLFIASLTGVVAQWTYDLFLVENAPAFAPGAVAMTLMIPLFGLGLIFFTRLSRSKGWIS